MKRIHVRPYAARKGSVKRGPVAAKHTQDLHEPAVCERCGAVYRHRTWRLGGRAGRVAPAAARRTVCPACAQVAGLEYFGRLRIVGELAPERESQVLHRIRNIEARARHTQPERRTVGIGRESEGIEILTTSQKLAHRIARELEKAFGGEAHYTWSEKDGSLEATWQPAVETTRRPAVRSRRPATRRRSPD